MLLLVILAVLCAWPAWAEDLTFSWQANAESENVVGYKLYSSRESRFDQSGQRKVGFQYDYSIDFDRMEQCALEGDHEECETLSPQEINCEELDGARPICTVQQLPGQQFYALTAYNSGEESEYTPEIRVEQEGVSPEVMASLLATYQILLLK